MKLKRSKSQMVFRQGPFSEMFGEICVGKNAKNATFDYRNQASKAKKGKRPEKNL
jgi:hypothetical protein